MNAIAMAVKTVLVTVSDEEALANQQAELARRMARKLAKEQVKKAAEEARSSQSVQLTLTQMAAPVANDQSFAKAKPVPHGVISTPTDAEREETRAAWRRDEARKARAKLIYDLRDSRPTKVEFISWVVKDNFIYSHDQGAHAVYVREGVEVVVFDGALGGNIVAEPLKHQPAQKPALSHEEREAKRKQNRERNAAQEAAAKARRDAAKAARKPKAAPPQGKKNKGGNKTADGKRATK
jgi:hypothetical protein